MLIDDGKALVIDGNDERVAELTERNERTDRSGGFSRLSKSAGLAGL
jgi:hypothetical protein